MSNHDGNRRLLGFAIAAAIAVSTLAEAQTPAPPVARFVAATANLKGGPDSVRIDVLSWSSDAFRSQLVDAWNLIPPAPGAAGRGGGTAAGGRGAAGARGARGGAAGAPEAAATPVPPTGRGAGRGGARGGTAAAGGNIAATAATRSTPEGALAAALQAAESVGYLWTSESTGYSLRYAYRLAQPDGSERIILATDRRLGSWDDSWKPAAVAPADYGFSIIELRLSAKHEGEGKASLTGKVAVDNSANTIAIENYATLPATLKDVKSR